MIVSIHIPKTAGTSLGYMLNQSNGMRVFFDYDPQYRYARDLCPLVEEYFGFITQYFRAIHGHFHYVKYAERLPDAAFITCVRHPVARAISQFKHVAALPDGADWRGPLIRSGEMSVVDFVASDDNIRQAMTIHLEGRTIEDYDFVFITERLEKGLRMFARRMGYGLSGELPHVNTSSSRSERRGLEMPPVTEEHKQKVYGLMPEDVDLYRRAVEAFG
jgi:hypothetical protein